MSRDLSRNLTAPDSELAAIAEMLDGKIAAKPHRRGNEPDRSADHANQRPWSCGCSRLRQIRSQHRIEGETCSAISADSSQARFDHDDPIRLYVETGLDDGEMMATCQPL